MHSHGPATHGGQNHSHSHAPSHFQAGCVGHSHSSAPHTPPPPPPYSTPPDSTEANQTDPSEVDQTENCSEAQHQATVVATFDSYRRIALSANQRRRIDYFRLTQAHQELLPDYPQLLNQIDDLLGKNAEFVQAVIEENPFPPAVGVVDAEAPQEADHERLRSTLRSVARDWSPEGLDERKSTYTPILDSLEMIFGHYEAEDKAATKILVPGAGLGRLAWEIVHAGYTCQANEFSLYMLIVSSYILNHTQAADVHAIHPYLHSFSNVRSNSDLLRPILVPDVDPSTIATTSLGEFSFAAGDFLEIYAQPSQQGTFDVVVTCFFIDTAKNIVDYLERIWGLLKEDGVWINIGPTLWHFENTPGSSSIELTLADVKALARRIGFELSDEHEVQTSYTSNPRSTLRHEYTASFWTARKQSPA